jgi:hypothetical protein
VPSASATAGLLVLASALLAGALAGCTTTQQTATRLHVRSERELAGRRPIDVKQADSNVHVITSSIVEGSDGGAIAVTLRNTGPKPVNDLPLAVGVKSANGSTAYLNDKGHLPYFQTHAPALGPGEKTTWVFTSSKVLPPGEPIARVGVAASHPPTTASSVPELEVGRVASSQGKQEGTSETTVETEVANHTGIPQYDLAVYAWAKRDGRYVAAGRGSVEDLGTDSTATVKLKLIGNPGGAQVRVAAPPTIFQ